MNVALALACVVQLGWLLKRFGVQDAWLVAGGMLGLPTFYVVSGMALTEIPAMVFVIPGVGLSLAAMGGIGAESRWLAIGGDCCWGSRAWDGRLT